MTKAARVGYRGNQTLRLDLSSQQRSDFNSGTKKPFKKPMAMDAVHPGETSDHCLNKSPERHIVFHTFMLTRIDKATLNISPRSTSCEQMAAQQMRKYVAV